jgi:predicted PurR-regulated permease PerM
VATLGVSVERAGVVLVLLVIYQQFEDRYLVPKVYGATLGLPPLVVLLVVLAGGQLLGIMGVLLALPGVAASRVIIAYARQHDDIVPNFKPTSQVHEEIAAPDGAATTEN